jgi:hypothetical protein
MRLIMAVVVVFGLIASCSSPAASSAPTKPVAHGIQKALVATLQGHDEDQILVYRIVDGRNTCYTTSSYRSTAISCVRSNY